MKQIRKRLTYANVMSTLAMFLVLGGATALAAHQLGKKTVGTKQLKSNAVTTAKIKREAVTTAKLKKEAVAESKLQKDAVTGSKILKETITGDKIKSGAIGAGQIGAGAIGASQIGANSVGNSQTQLAKVFKGEVVSAAVNEAAAPKIELGSVGPFHFYGKCFFEAANLREKTYIELTSGQATVGSESGINFPTNAKAEYLTPATPEAERAIERQSTAEPNKATATSADEEFQATATDGTQITGLIGGTGAKQGTPPEGNGPFLAGDSCIVGAVAVFGS